MCVCVYMHILKKNKKFVNEKRTGLSLKIVSFGGSQFEFSPPPLPQSPTSLPPSYFKKN